MSRKDELPFRLPSHLDRLYDERVLLVTLLLCEAALCERIIAKVPYTEIDWRAYMQQITTYLSGERDYFKLNGDTGPLVYPAGHVYVYSALYDLTDRGRNVKLAQIVFAALYCVTTAIMILMLLRCKRIPLYAIPLVSLSKRLHSIYLLRLFNDSVTAFFTSAMLLAVSQRNWRVTSIIYALALSIKMNALLYAPALGLLIVLDMGVVEAAASAALIVLIQVLLGLPFLLEHPSAYLSRSFDLSRAFLYAWTVNWRFAPESIFSSMLFAHALLTAHACLLLVFAWRRCRPHGGLGNVVRRAIRYPSRPAGLARLSAEDAVVALCTANLIGILCARSLHYQFFAWYAQQLVLLTWQTPFVLPLKLAILSAIEWAWNVFPSTESSSGMLLACHVILLAGLLGKQVPQKLEKMA